MFTGEVAADALLRALRPWIVPELFLTARLDCLLSLAHRLKYQDAKRDDTRSAAHAAREQSASAAAAAGEVEKNSNVSRLSKEDQTMVSRITVHYMHLIIIMLLSEVEVRPVEQMEEAWANLLDQWGPQTHDVLDGCFANLIMELVILIGQYEEVTSMPR